MESLKYIYTLVYGIIPEQTRRTIISNREFCAHCGVEFKVLNFDVAVGECAAGASDKKRFENAAAIPRILYVDWDCRIENLPEFDPAVPVVAQENGVARESWAMYNGDATDLFKEMLPGIQKNSERGWWGCHFSVLNSPEYKNKLSVFPDGFFKHLNINAGMQIKV